MRQRMMRTLLLLPVPKSIMMCCSIHSTDQAKLLPEDIEASSVLLEHVRKGLHARNLKQQATGHDALQALCSHR